MGRSKTAATERVEGTIGQHYVVGLSDIGRADAARCGHRAANLAELRAAGFPVPDGIIVTTTALDRLLSELPEDAEVSRERIAGWPVPDVLRKELSGALERFGSQPLAVRSSGVAEDLTGMSYAGQYETVLNVTGEHAVLAAVKKCWAS